MRIDDTGDLLVNHHTGGLENTDGTRQTPVLVNHHTGGLEMKQPATVHGCIVNHHTGGLERGDEVVEAMR